MKKKVTASKPRAPRKAPATPSVSEEIKPSVIEKVTCETCKGTGRGSPTTQCDPCLGTGKK